MKRYLDQITITFSSRSANESFARAAAACYVAQLDPTLDELADIKTAVSEAVTNAIVRGEREAVQARLSATSPLLLDILPLTLEEIFIYEMEALGYAFHDVL